MGDRVMHPHDVTNLVICSLAVTVRLHVTQHLQVLMLALKDEIVLQVLDLTLSMRQPRERTKQLGTPTRRSLSTIARWARRISARFSRSN